MQRDLPIASHIYSEPTGVTDAVTKVSGLWPKTIITESHQTSIPPVAPTFPKTHCKNRYSSTIRTYLILPIQCAAFITTLAQNTWGDPSILPSITEKVGSRLFKVSASA